MVTGDNKGHVYEKKIVKILQDRKLVPEGATGAGSGPGTDAVFLHNKKQFKLEIKNNVTSPDYGQKRLIPYLEGKKWKWNWAPGVIDEKITKHYTSLGVLDYLNKKNITPNKYRKSNDSLTLKDVKQDQENFEDKTYAIGNEAFVKFYEDKANYVQVGKGFGLFHLKSDKAKLGTEKFNGEFILRFRAKRHTTKNNHSYSFFAVLKCKKVLKRSKYNLEEDLINSFPPIKP
jgi:hypothetical protein